MSSSAPGAPLPRSVRSAGPRLPTESVRPVPRAPRTAWPALAILALVLAACRGRPLLEAERAAPVGSEFIRLFGDGTAEYGYGVVKENFKARGAYRYARDTVWFLDESFRPHFPAGYLPIKGDVLYMESGLHFRIKANHL